MIEIEQSIIDKLIELNVKALVYDTRIKKQEELQFLLQKLEKRGLGKATSEFLRNEKLQEYLNLKGTSYIYGESNNAFKFRILIENYLNATDKKLNQEYFSKIKARVIELHKEITKPNGQGLLPDDINRDLIRNIYLSDNKELIDLFRENLPIPEVEVFEGYIIPDFIRERIVEATETVLKFLKVRALSSLERSAKTIQREFRATRRQKEERIRILGYPSIPGDTEADRKAFIEQALADANKPYRPKKCSKELAGRIFDTAGKIELFSTVHHLTSQRHLENMFNESLYGRRNLLKSYLPFKPAALGKVDLERGGGDANVICFGPKSIDPTAIQPDPVDIVFDLNKLARNPCVFFKQRDLGYNPPGTIRKVKIGNNNLLFSHTEQASGGGYTDLRIFKGLSTKSKLLAVSQLPNYCFISYNVPAMHQILVLNFFRFLDTLQYPNIYQELEEPEEFDSNSRKIEGMIKTIYTAIEKLNEKELIEFLTTLGQQMTDTAEFNFYGAYKIDFSAINVIRKMERRIKTGLKIAVPVYELNLQAFIKDLQSGDKGKLREAIEKLPTAFKSYRFLDYLRAKVQHKEIQEELLRLREACTLPLLLMSKMQKTPSTSTLVTPTTVSLIAQKG